MGFNRDPHFQRVMQGYRTLALAGLLRSFNRDPHFQRVMPAHVADDALHRVGASIGTLIFRG